MERSILVVEDDDLLREGVVELLEGDSWTVYSASNGATALKIFRAHPIEVVLTDLRMPMMDGVQLIHQLRDVDPEVPIVVLTAYGTMEHLRDALRAGATDFMHKPFEYEALLATMSEAYLARARGALPDEVLERSECTLRFEIEADRGLIAGIAAEIDMLARHLGFYGKRWLIRRAVEEALDNAVVHGAGSDSARKIHVCAEFSPDALGIRIEDPGGGFDPVRKFGELSVSEEQRRKGIFLMKSFCDEVKWEGVGNVVTLRFLRPSTRHG